MSLRQYVSFSIDGVLFGLDILLVKEINRKLEVTPAHDVANFVVGSSNLRGQVITILDIGRRLNLAARELTVGSQVLVLKSEHELAVHHKSGQLTQHASVDSVGIVVDQVGDAIELDDRDIQAIPANFGKLEVKFANGMYQMENDLVVMLNLEAILTLEEAATAS